MSRHSNQRALRKNKNEAKIENSPPAKQNPKVKTFLNKHWAIILSLLIASSGGVPGCITIWNAVFHSKPIITFQANTTSFAVRPGGQVQFLESWTILNSGDKPLVLVAIDGYVKCHEIEFQMATGSPPETYTGDSGDGKDKIKLPNVRSKDLQLVKQISSNEYKRGFLAFILDRQSVDIISQCGRDVEIKIVCRDIFGNKYDSGYRMFGAPLERNGADTLFAPHDSIEITRK